MKPDEQEAPETKPGPKREPDSGKGTEDKPAKMADHQAPVAVATAAQPAPPIGVFRRTARKLAVLPLTVLIAVIAASAYYFLMSLVGVTR
jgi:hypothetical protein